MEAFDAHSVLNLRDEPRMLDALRHGLSWATDARFAVSFTRFSGLQLLVDPVKEQVARGGAVKLLTSTYLSTTQPEALSALLELDGVECRVQDGPDGFHSKFFWFRGPSAAECWAGSSNLSAGGLSTNLEWNLRSRDLVRIRETEAQFNALWSRPDVKPLTHQLIESYSQRYHATSPGWFLDAAQKGPRLVVPNAAQREALANLAALRARGGRSAAIIAATGIGKTYLAAFDVEAANAKRVLYVSHRLEHLLHAKHSFAAVLSNRTLGIVGGGYGERNAAFIFATIQSLRGDRELLNRRWDYLIIDEFHHVEAPSYEVLRPLKKHAFLLGLTATPERQDGHDVLAWCDWNVAYEVRLAEAIERGWLLPFHYFGIADETVDFAKIQWRSRIPIEVLERELSIESRARMILHEALVRGFDGPRRATVGFCAGLRHARFMADVFNRHGQVAAVATGQMELHERNALYRRFADPDDPLEWLFVSDLLNEGVDIPAINSLLFLRPTESAGLFLQQLGRGLRLSPGTEVLTVLDFVGHHRSAWITLKALSDPKGTGRKVNVEGLVIKPPRACEVVLQSRTREILARIGGLSKKDRCSDAYQRLREQIDRPMPVDLWHRSGLPDFSEMKQAFGDWVQCEQRHQNAPAWSRGLPEDHIVRRFLAAAEKNWQAQRVTPYARFWGLCHTPADPRQGYEAFFRRYPQWQPEYVPFMDGVGGTLEKKVPEDCIPNGRLAPAIVERLGDQLLFEVEGRMMYAVNDDYDARHGGVLRTPDQLTLHQRYMRPESVRHFGVQYDPARHNAGILWFDELSAAAIITKLDTSGAVAQHQYRNEIVDAQTFLWTSQNRMRQDNAAGRRVLDHQKNGEALHLFVQPHSHAEAVYLGPVDVTAVEGNGPMRVTFKLRHPLGSVLLDDLRGEDDEGWRAPP